jgi:hypothetical protein
MVIAALGMITGVAALVIRQWSNLAGGVRHQAQPAPRKKPIANEAAPMQLPPRTAQEPIGSVTDHTTRTFDPIYRKPAERGN